LIRRIGLVLTALIVVGCGGGSRFVRQRELTSRESPAVTIDVAPEFSYVGRVAFTLENQFEGERYLFADAQGKKLRRLVVAHFERILPTSQEIYHYDVASGQPIGPLRFVNNSFAFAGAQTVTDPKNEADRTNNFLLERGFQMPATWLVTRFVTIGAEDRKSELILFYMEGRDDMKVADLYDGEEPTEAWKQMKVALAERGRASFTLR